MKKRFVVLASALMIIAQPFVADAHSGRTDSSGGHRDNKNKSGLGSYHYHCGGYPAHLHTNGCPYTGGGSSESSSSSQGGSNSNSQSNNSSKVQVPSGPSRQSIIEKGSNEGYNDGYNMRDSREYSYSGSYESDYQEAYREAFDKGEEKVKKEESEAREKGYNDGKSNNYDNVYVQETVVKSYKENFDKGNKEYKDEKIAEYRVLGKNDCENNIKDRNFESGVDSEFIDAYKASYEDTYTNIKNEEHKAIGYKNGIINKYNNKIDSKYKASYDEGFNIGADERSKVLEDSFNQGYEGEALKFDEKFNPIKSEIEKQYNEGEKESKKDLAMGLGGTAVVGVAGVVAFKKIKKKKSS